MEVRIEIFNTALGWGWVWGWDNFKLSKICTFSFLCHLVIWNYYSKSWLLVTVTYLNVQYYCLLRDFPYWLQLFWLQVKLKSQFGDFRIEVLGYLRSPTILHMATKFNYHVLGVKKIAASGNGVWEQFFFLHFRIWQRSLVPPFLKYHIFNFKKIDMLLFKSTLQLS